MSFKDRYTLAQRIEESEKIKVKYPDRVPIIVGLSKELSVNIPHLFKSKYLVPDSFIIGQFIYVLRKQIKISPVKAIFMFVGKGVLPPTHSLISLVYKEHVAEDGFLYVELHSESVFG